MRALLASVPDHSFLDEDVAVREARRFKVDVSFAFGDDEVRWSVNDKGEPEAFRDRLERRFGSPFLGAFLELSPPGEVQTTVSFKHRDGRLDRLGLYFEELRDDAVLRAVASSISVEPPPPPADARPVAVCVDVVDGQPTGFKDYWLLEETDTPHPALPSELRPLASRFPLHPTRQRRRLLWARRTGLDSVVVGHKVMWMTESRTRETSAAAWAVVDRLAEGLAPCPALVALRGAWSHEEFLHPDLVSLDTDANGDVRRLLAYTSIR
ncbi:MAG: hypothetical protein GY913_18355 [Proteobacteria bacterium]|nr:hypothetical protein [Pseudomonadota bacterium]MCP4918872.1 hypothetical protein [Pseudomonadota bacterium]